MKRTARLLMLTLCALLPAACGTGHAPRADLMPMPGDALDPPDEAARAAVRAFLSETGAPAFSMYQLARHDLDGDARREALVLFNNPFGYWCDRHGCTMLIFRAGDTDFTLLNAVQPVRGPLHISRAATNGWRDLIIRVSGRWDETKDVALQFNGERYPLNPAALPPYTRIATYDEVRVFNEY